MTCDRYPDRAVIPLKQVQPEMPSKMRADFLKGCDHGHASAFEGETFACGGTLTGPRNIKEEGSK